MKSRLIAAGVTAAAFVASPVWAVDDGRTEEDVKNAMKLMEEVAAAYKKAPTITDTVQMSYEMPGMGSQEMEMSIRMGKGNETAFSFSGFMDLVSTGDSIYVTSEMYGDTVVKADLEGDLMESIENALGQGGALPPHYALRFGDDLDAALAAMTMGMTTNPKIVGHKMIEKDDAKLHEVIIDADGNDMLLHVDPKTNLLAGMHFEGAPEGAPEGMTMVLTMAMEPVVADKLAEPIAFDLAGRDTVGSMEELFAAEMNMAGLEPGDVAPEFTLTDTNGKTHRLADYKGKVVILDWWGIW